MTLLQSRRARLNMFRFRLAVGLFLILASPSFARDDWQFYNNYDFEHALSEKLDLTLQVEGRLNRDVGNLYYYFFQPGFNCHINDFLDFGLGYRYIKQERARSGEDPWDDENRLVIDPVLKWKFSKFAFDNRCRFEYRYFDLDKDKWRYRNRLRVKKKFKIGEFEFSPFLSDEVFYDFNTDEFNENQFDLGIERKIIENIRMSLFYRLQSQRQGRDWNESNIIGLRFKFNL